MMLPHTAAGVGEPRAPLGPVGYALYNSPLPLTSRQSLSVKLALALLSQRHVLLAFLPACVTFNVAICRRAVARPVQPRLAWWSVDMKSKEDKEFEEWVRKKKIASGVDPDEDFAAGRAQERSIFQVGGAPPVL